MEWRYPSRDGEQEHALTQLHSNGSGEKSHSQLYQNMMNNRCSTRLERRASCRLKQAFTQQSAGSARRVCRSAWRGFR